MPRYRNAVTGTVVSAPESTVLGYEWVALDGAEEFPAVKFGKVPDKKEATLGGGSGSTEDISQPIGRGDVPSADTNGDGKPVRRRAAAKG